MTQPAFEPREPDNPTAYALAKHIADHPVSTIQAAFRYLNAPLMIELREGLAVVPPVDRAAVRDRIREVLARSDGFDFESLEPHDYQIQAEAVLAVLPEPADRAAVLSEVAGLVRSMAPEHPTNAAWVQDCHRIADRIDERGEELRRLADEPQPAEAEPTPCSQPNPCEDGELCATHEEEQAHAEGEHQFCGVTCEVAMPTELMRNSLIAWSPPGGKGILAELERRAAAGPVCQDPIECSHEAMLGEAEARLHKVLGVAEVIEANGVGWAADSVRRAAKGELDEAAVEARQDGAR